MGQKRYTQNYFLLFFSALALSSTMSAKVVSQEEALQVATNFFFNGNAAQTPSATRQLKEIWNSDRLSQGDISPLSGGAPTFYVFAPETGKGFVIVSGDDAMNPILGYSFDDEAPEGELPCNLKMWFVAMHNHIIQMRTEGRAATEETKRQWERVSVGNEVLSHETVR